VSRPVVTLLVPGRDVGAFAAEALASLRGQTFADWRAILVDDGSADVTSTVFDDAAAEDDRIRVIRHAESRGLGAARNAALDLVDTPYVGFLDADDILRPRALERLVGTVTATGNDLVVGSYVRLRPDVDGGYRAGDAIPTQYDSLVAKLIAHGSDRDEAISRMAAALCRRSRGGSRISATARAAGSPIRMALPQKSCARPSRVSITTPRLPARRIRSIRSSM